MNDLQGILLIFMLESLVFFNRFSFYAYMGDITNIIFQFFHYYIKRYHDENS